MRTLTLTLVGMLSVAAAVAGEQHKKSPYAGQETRQIKSLSADDVEELHRGGGWGLAKTAELNGFPGPTHLLELADQINLTDNQIEAIEAIRSDMQVRAIETGRKFVNLEKELDREFQSGTITSDRLGSLLSQIALVRGQLRLVHLSAHLQTRPLLTEHQVADYNRLRGYSEDPCAAVPSGHDPNMWRKHNGCE